MNFVVRQMRDGDVDGLSASFSPLNKEKEMFQTFWKEHREGERVTFVAVSGDRVVAYTNLLWLSDYTSFRERDVPEINNMHVLDEFQRQGIGTALIREAEGAAEAQGKGEIGIGFGLTSDYAAAQRLYPKLGYIPDGLGAQPTPWGDVLYLTRRLR